MVLQLCYCVFFWIAEFSIGPFKEIYQVNVIRFLYLSYWIFLLDHLPSETFNSQDKFMDIENSDGDDDDDLELSDDEDDFVENRRQPKRLKIVATKTSKGRKLPMPAQRKRGVSHSDEEYSSGKDSDVPSDSDFKHRSKKPDRLHQKPVGCSDVAPINSHNELRTSGRRRTVKKISYAESEESDDSEEKSTKQQKVSSIQTISEIAILSLRNHNG